MLGCRVKYNESVGLHRLSICNNLQILIKYLYEENNE